MLLSLLRIVTKSASYEQSCKRSRPHDCNATPRTHNSPCIFTAPISSVNSSRWEWRHRAKLKFTNKRPGEIYGLASWNSAYLFPSSSLFVLRRKRAQLWGSSVGCPPRLACNRVLAWFPLKVSCPWTRFPPRRGIRPNIARPVRRLHC